mmetsp:Transcript_5215/g.12489  ORF Transcript_5215/g.12489 Transcript_5215/m.12489 type:complete len:312 (-) Transcript_5215:108-1043(-)|eukprot:CAMPEP_0206451934 /NCGR_PEP_ID=MMETSP0324_2-20121206/19639_1 /ASSEMBLY_ACC=CAM_ASM_000836 /TAXON_ID=2866 /ORGANISM="Crypthecodinium cohnii, Strain Seligo" /LENGTH=311 /DNA_ID=CAMNT_0053921915 /DNA_START=268 /DNA_END=1203 /DNA_ORIENTATION=+
MAKEGILAKACHAVGLPSEWRTKGKGLDWRTLIQVSRPGWWLVHVWLYLAPTGQQYHLLTTLRFWAALFFALFPLNLLVYGVNDCTDVELDAQNSRKGNFIYGAKCTPDQIRELPKAIASINIFGILLLAVLSGHYLRLFVWLAVCALMNIMYNVEPMRLSSKGPFELPLVVVGFSGVTILASLINDIPMAPFRYWVHMTCLVLRTQLWTELMDHDEDAKCNRRTTSILLGKPLSKVATLLALSSEAAVTFIFFDDWLMRFFSLSGIAAFGMLEIAGGGADDKDKMKAMKAHFPLGMTLVFWIWYKGLFAP